MIKVKDKKFEISIPEAEIHLQVKRVAQELKRDLEGREPLFLAMLNGAFIFAADLMREITFPAEISFVKFSSYCGMESTGCVKEVIGLNEDIAGRDVVIVEDIIDSGLTMKRMMEALQEKHPRSISLCTLLVKPESLKVKLDIRYCCFEIPNDFILGYGLDYDGFGRNTRDIYTVMD